MGRKILMLLPVSFFLSGGEGEYFLTPMSITLAGSGGGGGVQLTSDGNFLPRLESILG